MSMKWLTIYLFVMSLTTDILSADLTNETTTINEDVALQLVQSYNKELKGAYGANVPEIKKGIMSKGELDIMYVEGPHEETIMIARFMEDSQPENKCTIFKISVEKHKWLPEEIKEGRIVYIGNQLIIKDLNSNKEINFFLPSDTVINKTPYLETVKAKMINVKRSNAVEINI